MAPKLTPQERIVLVKRVIEGGEPVAKVCREVGISRVLFYKWLRRFKEEGRKALEPRRAGRRRLVPSKIFKKVIHLSPRKRLEMFEEVLEKGEPVSKIAREYGISRTLFYRLLKRYKEAPEEERLEALEPKKAYIERYFRQTPERFERSVLALVVKHPEFGVRRLVANLPRVAGVPIIGHHGVQNILRRAGLSLYEQRLVWSQAQVTPVTRAIGKIVYYLSRFIALPVEVRAQVIRFAGITAISAFLTIVILGIGGFWLTVVSGVPLAAQVGLVFASTALLMGSLFFLYSMKYYFTLAIVLSFSQQSGGINGNGRRPGWASGPEGRKNGILSWILGLGSSSNGLGINGDRSLPRAQRGVGLEPSLEHVVLKRKPFVSVHIPFYNEKNVAERMLAAVTAFDWANYEVIVVDDSTDETTAIVRRFIEQWKSQNTNHKIQIKHIHRTSREGFKGGALREALRASSPKAEFVVVFDADFVPYPDTLELFLKYFKLQNNMSEDYKKSQVAVVQGYQWHVLNKSENWITRGVRSEYSGSYVIERSGQEILGALKMVSGSVYMIRKDVLDEIGWETSITEDFELTLKLYEKGYKVVYTPYIQAPAECVSTIKRLVRQRMRWAEGHSHNIRRMFTRLLFGHWETADVVNNQIPNPKSQINSNIKIQNSKWRPSPLTFMEKLEFLYLSPYYLQAFFFLLGTLSWLISETIFPARLPFWTSLWGWSLVLTNFLALPLLNGVGLFLEEAEERDFVGLLSFIALSYILVPFQAYAAIKGFLEREEGPWFRTPKTGRITDIFTRGRFYRLIAGILPGRTGNRAQGIGYSSLNPNAHTLNPYLSLATANSRFNSFTLKPKRMRWMGKLMLVFVLTLSLLVHSMAINPTPVEATWFDTGYLYRKKLTIDNTLVSGSANHSNFPVLVSYTDASLKTTANGGQVTNSSGFDIIFTDDDKTTKLDHEIEKYTATTGEIVMWVRIPTLPYNVDKDIYIYYGNSSVTTSQENVTGVWNANYVDVLHLKESPNGTTNEIKDSTSNNNHGTTVGGMSSIDSVDAKIGKGLDLDGLDGVGGDHISVADSASLDGTVDEGSWSLWINWGDWGSEQKVIMAIANRYTAPTDGYEWGAQAGTPDGNLFAYPWARDPNYNLNTATDFTNGLWHYISVRYDWTSRTLTLNLDGNDLTNSINNVNTTNWTQQANITAAWLWGGSPQRNTRFIMAKIDEIRVSDVSRSLGWIQTEFNNQNNQGTGTGKFIKTLGSEEQVPELIVLLLPLAILIPYFVKYMERRKKMYLGIRG